MIWTQSFICFLGWIGFGFWLRTRSALVASNIKRVAREKQVIRSGLAMIGGALILIASLFLVGAIGGMTRDGLTWWGWILVFVGGLGFTYFQVVAALSMVILLQPERRAETPASRETSEQKESESN